MKLGIISDIHGNLVALDAVLAALKRHRPDRIICLGDVAADGPDPVGCLKRLQDLNCDVVIGNTDADLLSGKVLSSDNEDWQKIYEIEAWAMAQLSAADKDFINSFQPTIEISLQDNLNALCYHGSPKSFNDIIRADTPSESIAPWFEGIEAKLLIGGHTHHQMLRRWEDRLLVNCGSVGMPYKRGRNPLWAEYALVQVQSSLPLITLARAPICKQALIDSAQQSTMPHAQWWLSEWH